MSLRLLDSFVLRGRLRLLDTLFLRYLLKKVSPKGGTRILDLSGMTDEPAVIRQSVLRGRLRLLATLFLMYFLTRLARRAAREY